MRPETGANTLCRTLALRDIHIIAVLQSVRRTLRIVHQVQPTIQAMTYVLHPTQKLAVRDIHLMAQTMCATNPRNVRAVHSMHHGISAGMYRTIHVLPDIRTMEVQGSARLTRFVLPAVRMLHQGIDVSRP